MSAASVPSKKVWMSLFSAAGLPSGSIAKYADIFASERLRLEMVVDLSRTDFEELGITALGDQLAIKKQAEKLLRERRSSQSEETDSDDARDQHRHARQPRKRTPEKHKPEVRARDKPSALSRLALVKKRADSDEESMGEQSDRESEGEDEEMEVDVKVKSPTQRNVDRTAAVHRLRVVRKDQPGESKRALRMLTLANSAAASSSHRESDDDNRGPGSKMRSDSMPSSSSNLDKNLPPPDPVNNLSRLASPAKPPVLEPVLIRNLKSTLKTSGSALKRLGPRKVGADRLPETVSSKQSALSRLDKGGAGARFRTEQRGSALLRTIEGLGTAEKPRHKAAGLRGSALQRLGGRSRDKSSADGEAPHPLSRC